MCRYHWNGSIVDWLSVRWHQSHHAYIFIISIQLCTYQICCKCFTYYLSLDDRFHAGGSCMAHMLRETLCWGLPGWILGRTAHKTGLQSPGDRNKIPPMGQEDWLDQKRWRLRSGLPLRAVMCLERKEEKRQEERFVIKVMLTKDSSKMIIIASEACWSVGAPAFLWNYGYV